MESPKRALDSRTDGPRVFFLAAQAFFGVGNCLSSADRAMKLRSRSPASPINKGYVADDFRKAISTPISTRMSMLINIKMEITCFITIVTYMLFGVRLAAAQILKRTSGSTGAGGR